MPFQLRTLGGLAIVRDGVPLDGAIAHRSRLSLLALLARQGAGVGRDRIVALIWPESDADRARNALRQALHVIRRELGESAILGSAELRLNRDAIRSDVAAFEEALGRGQSAAAAALYAGPFLDGFFLRNSPEFEQWVDGERALLAKKYRHALEQLADRKESEGDPVRASEWWGRLAVEDPLSSRVALRLMTALIAASDRPSALRYGRAHVAHVREELGSGPDPEIAALIERLEREGHSSPSERQLAAGTRSAAVTVVPAQASPRPASAPTDARRASRRPVVAALTVLALVVPVILLAPREREPAIDPDRVAVLPFANLSGDSAFDSLGRIAADWIAQGLAKTGVAKVAPLGLDQWSRAHASPSTDPAAGLIVHGSLYVVADTLRLHATLTDWRGTQIGALDEVTVGAHESLQGIERVRQQVMSLLATHLDPQFGAWATSARQPTTFSAYREFAAGMEAYARNDPVAAWDRFMAAVAADSGYTLPLLWAAYANPVVPGRGWVDYLAIFDARRPQLTAFELAFADYLTALYRDRDAEAAYQAARRLSALAPGSDWMTIHGAAALDTRRPYEAVRMLERVDTTSPLLEQPRGSGYWGTFASALLQTGRAERALSTARAGLARRIPGIESGLQLLEGASLAVLGRIAALDSLRESVFGTQPVENRDVLPLVSPVLWSQELLAHGHESAAARMLEWAMARYASMPATQQHDFRTRIIHGHMLWLARRYDEAHALYSDLLRETAPGSWLVRANLGMNAARAGHPEVALEQLEWVREHWAESPIAPYYEFELLAALGRTQEALAVLRAHEHRLPNPPRGMHMDYAFPLFREHSAYLDVLRPKDGPHEPMVR